jgi:translation initiation factor SUI1
MDLSIDFNDSAVDEFTKRFEKIHIRVIQRNTRSCITLLEKMDDDLDLNRICKAMRRAFNCNGNVKKTEQGEEVIQLQGDQHETIRAWLLEQEILTAKEAEERLVVHRAV